MINYIFVVMSLFFIGREQRAYGASASAVAAAVAVCTKKPPVSAVEGCVVSVPKPLSDPQSDQSKPYHLLYSMRGPQIEGESYLKSSPLGTHVAISMINPNKQDVYHDVYHLKMGKILTLFCDDIVLNPCDLLIARQTHGTDSTFFFIDLKDLTCPSATMGSFRSGDYLFFDSEKKTMVVVDAKDQKLFMIDNYRDLFFARDRRKGPLPTITKYKDKRIGGGVVGYAYNKAQNLMAYWYELPKPCDKTDEDCKKVGTCRRCDKTEEDCEQDGECTGLCQKYKEHKILVRKIGIEGLEIVTEKKKGTEAEDMQCWLVPLTPTEVLLQFSDDGSNLFFAGKIMADNKWHGFVYSLKDHSFTKKKIIANQMVMTKNGKYIITYDTSDVPAPRGRISFIDSNTSEIVQQYVIPRLHGATLYENCITGCEEAKNGEYTINSYSLCSPDEPQEKIESQEEKKEAKA